jgi:recombinational DNA repair ATPase RecF
VSQYEYARNVAHDRLDELILKLHEEMTRDYAMGMALLGAARVAGLELNHDAQEIIAMAQKGDFKRVMLRTPQAVGLSPEEFQALHALIYG